MAMVCRGIRGATTADENTKEAIIEATKELLAGIVEANSFNTEDVAATFFTTTQDLNTEFPAVGARQMGWVDVPLMCGHEMNVPDAQPLCIRVLVLLNTEKSQKEMSHVYLKGATGLRNRGVSPSRFALPVGGVRPCLPQVYHHSRLLKAHLQGGAHVPFRGG